MRTPKIEHHQNHKASDSKVLAESEQQSEQLTALCSLPKRNTQPNTKPLVIRREPCVTHQTQHDTAKMQQAKTTTKYYFSLAVMLKNVEVTRARLRQDFSQAMLLNVKVRT